MKNKVLHILCVLVLLVCFGCERMAVLSPESSQIQDGYVWETISVDGVTFLELTASSDFEDFAGNTRDADGKKVGFTLIDGVFSTHSFPGATQTLFYALSNTGVAAGHYQAPDGSYHGVILEEGVLRQYDVPEADETFILGVSDTTGVFTGNFIRGETTYGFSGERIIQYPGAPITLADFVNAAGTIVGSYQDATGGYHGYTYTEAGDFTTFSVPLPAGMPQTDLLYIYVNGINDAGEIVFRTQVREDVPRAYVIPPGGTPKEVTFPGSVSTEVWNINQDGSFVGHYDTPDGQRHGFIARPGPVE